MLILGIDPGLAIVGYGLVDYTASKFTTVAYGAVTTKAHTPTPERISEVYEGICGVIDKYKPEEAAVEQLFFNTNQKTAITVAEARGVILLALKNKGVAINEYTPLQVKQSVVGYGRAEKKQVMEMTGIILGLEKMPKLDDTCDALAMAVCHAHARGSVLFDLK